MQQHDRDIVVVRETGRQAGAVRERAVSLVLEGGATGIEVVCLGSQTFKRQGAEATTGQAEIRRRSSFYRLTFFLT